VIKYAGRLANGLGEERSGDGHQQDVRGRERADAGFDRGAESGDDDGEFSARDEGEPCPEACAAIAGLSSSGPVTGEDLRSGGDKSKRGCREKNRRKRSRIDFQSEEEKERGGEEVA